MSVDRKKWVCCVRVWLWSVECGLLTMRVPYLGNPRWRLTHRWKSSPRQASWQILASCILFYYYCYLTKPIFPNACSYNARCVANRNVHTSSPMNHHSMLSFHITRSTICWRHMHDPSHRDTWRYRRQCLIKFYNLERLKWSPMGSALKSRTLPLRLAVAVLCVRILSGFLSIKLQLLLFLAEHPQPVHENDRSEKIYSCFVGPTMVLNASASCQCSEISTMEHGGYRLAWAWVPVVLLSELPVSLWSMMKFVLGNCKSH